MDYNHLFVWKSSNTFNTPEGVDNWLNRAMCHLASTKINVWNVHAFYHKARSIRVMWLSG